MKKKFLVLVTVFLLLVSVLGLTACDGFLSKWNIFDKDNIETPSENDKTENDSPLVEETQPGNTTAISSVYNFSLATMLFAGMIAPDDEINDETTSDQLAEAYAAYLEQLREYQIYLNEVNAYYVGAQIEFYNNGTAVIKYSSGDEQEYKYVNKSQYDPETRTFIKTVQIGDYIGLYGDDNLILYMSFDEDDLFVVYLEFEVDKANV